MNEKEMRVVKIASCPSLSGKSTLTYHIGCMDDRAIYLRLAENTGQGNFSKGWIPLVQLDPLLESVEAPLTAKLVRSLFDGKSVNTSGFFMAVLVAEGLLKVTEDAIRSYFPVDRTEFMNGIHALIDSGVSLGDNLASNEGQPVPGKKAGINKAH